MVPMFPRWSYDVFISFRGGDTREGFTDHLYHALIDAEINAYRDENELRRGEDISSELLTAIENSRISIVVFSGEYASSRWCLDELVKIMDCRRSRRQRVLPLFYGVDPTDVRHQTGTFAKAFALHEERFGEKDPDKVAKWRSALTDAANLSGWDLNSTAQGHEAKFIKKIVKHVKIEVDHTYLDVAKHPVGLDSRVLDVSLLLKVGLDDTRMVGIYGMGGIGKTTIAKSIFNEFFHNFDGKSFLENVKDVSKDDSGIIALQEQLLFDILRKKIRISNVSRGINVIKERLCNIKALIVIDDVNDIDQLNALARNRDWFGLGTRIIITTRDKHLLEQIGVVESCMVKELDDAHSLELFSWHAFKSSQPPTEYSQLSLDVVSYCQGLPLAIEVLGSYLINRSMDECNSALEKLKKTTNNKIQMSLRISYDALDDMQQDIFLDIACFFVGADKDYVIKILDGCGLFATEGINVLVSRCLVKMAAPNKLMMHDLLQDMAKDIIREKSPKDLGKRSRLCFYEDVLHVLKKNKGTDVIEGIALRMPSQNAESLKSEWFSKMDRLRLLQLNYVQINGNFEHFSEELRWFCWHGCPLKSLPGDFYQENLIAIDLQYSKLNQVWNVAKLMDKMKILNVSHSHTLTRTPDFSKLPNLEILKLEDCINLREIHQSIGELNKLVELKVEHCIGLKTLPDSIVKLTTLEILDLSSCSNIYKLPEDIGMMKSMTKLILDDTAIWKLPPSIASLEKLRCLSLNSPKQSSGATSISSKIWSWILPGRNTVHSAGYLLPASVQGMNSLTELQLSNCSLSEDSLPRDLWRLPCLTELKLQGNDFERLPYVVSSSPKLKSLSLDGCTRLRSIPELPSCLRMLSAKNCSSLKRLPDMSNFSDLPYLSLDNCENLVEIPGLEFIRPTGNLHLHGCNSLSESFKRTLLLKWSQKQCGELYLPGKEIPDGFHYRSEGSSLWFQVPRDVVFSIRGITVCVVYEYGTFDSSTPAGAFSSFTVFNQTRKEKQTYHPGLPTFATPTKHHLFFIHLPFDTFGTRLLIKGGDLVQVFVWDYSQVARTIKCGVRLVFDR